MPKKVRANIAGTVCNKTPQSVLERSAKSQRVNVTHIPTRTRIPRTAKKIIKELDFTIMRIKIVPRDIILWHREDPFIITQIVPLQIKDVNDKIE